MASSSEVTDDGAFFCMNWHRPRGTKIDVTRQKNRDNARGEIRMSHEFENNERASHRLPDCQFTQTGYTASYSYLVEAELDREWEKTVRNGKNRSRKRLEVFVHKEGRL
jgi:hypothetical protein